MVPRTLPAIADIDREGWPLHHVPHWDDAAPEPVHRTRRGATMADILADIGLISPARVRGMVAAWRELYAELSPDVVIADYAPGAVLAARGRVPCLAAGVGYVLPPAHLAPLPPLHDLHPPIFDEDAVRAAVNDGLEALGIAPLTRLVEALAGDEQAVLSLPILDPYDAFRPEPALGAVFAAPPPAPSDERRRGEIFCYFRAGLDAATASALADAFVGLPLPVRAYLPDLPDAHDGLRRSGVAVLDSAAPMDAQLPRTSLIVHFGGQGTAAAALVAGVPQVIASFDQEKYLIGNALADRGVARHIQQAEATAAILRDLIRSAAADAKLADAARQAAAEHAPYRQRDVVGRVVAIAASLVR